jgi:hypothetical protein
MKSWTTSSRNRAFIFMALGFAIWALAFAVLYAVQATGCELGWHRQSVGPLSLLRALLIAIWGAHMAALVWLYLLCRRALVRIPAQTTPDVFLWRASAALMVASTFAGVWIGLALWVPSICAV